VELTAGWNSARYAYPESWENPALDQTPEHLQHVQYLVQWQYLGKYVLCSPTSFIVNDKP
jgi:hypothetical protein